MGYKRIVALLGNEETVNLAYQVDGLLHSLKPNSDAPFSYKLDFQEKNEAAYRSNVTKTLSRVNGIDGMDWFATSLK